MISNSMEQLFSLSGKTAVVTGGSGGLGRSICVALASAGAAVYLISRDLDKARSQVRELTRAKLDLRPLAMDVTCCRSVERARDELYGQGVQQIDCLVNAAGGNDPAAVVSPNESLSDIDLEAFRRVLILNCESVFTTCQLFLPMLLAAEAASIINIGSMAGGDRPLSRVCAYSLAKAAVRNFTRWLALEMATKHGERVRVNGIDPGFFLTTQNWELLVTDPVGSPPPHNLTARGKQIVAQTPFGRFGRPEELQALCVALASPRATSFVTGQIWGVDGGFSASSI